VFSDIIDPIKGGKEENLNCPSVVGPADTRSSGRITRLLINQADAQL